LGPLLWGGPGKKGENTTATTHDGDASFPLYIPPGMSAKRHRVRIAFKKRLVSECLGVSIAFFRPAVTLQEH
jgi:hypothetical protein